MTAGRSGPGDAATLARDVRRQGMSRAQFLAALDDAAESMAATWRRERRDLPDAYRELRQFRRAALEEFDRGDDGREERAR